MRPMGSSMEEFHIPWVGANMGQMQSTGKQGEEGVKWAMREGRYMISEGRMR